MVIMTAAKLPAAFAIFASVALSQAPPPTLTVHGISASTATLSPSDLGKLPVQPVKATDHGTLVTFEGVLLSDVLAKVRTPTGEAFNKTVAAYYVMAEAHDGYRAVFSWAEVDPSFTDRKLYLVTKRDGKPLAERDGPFELIVRGEKRYSRWVRQLTLLRIEPLPSNALQMAFSPFILQLPTNGSAAKATNGTMSDSATLAKVRIRNPVCEGTLSPR